MLEAYILLIGICFVNGCRGSFTVRTLCGQGLSRSYDKDGSHTSLHYLTLCKIVGMLGWAKSKPKTESSRQNRNCKTEIEHKIDGLDFRWKNKIFGLVLVFRYGKSDKNQSNSSYEMFRKYIFMHIHGRLSPSATCHRNRTQIC